MKKGYVTVFFSLVLSCVLGLFSVMLIGIRENARRERIRIASDTAIESLFGNYNRYLWDNYKLFYCDYCTDSFIPINTIIEESYINCLNRNTVITETGITDLLNIKCILTEVYKINFATDYDFASLKKQILRYMSHEKEDIYLKYKSISALLSKGSFDLSFHEKYNAASSRLGNEEVNFILNRLGVSKKIAYWTSEKTNLLSDLFNEKEALSSYLSIDENNLFSVREGEEINCSEESDYDSDRYEIYEYLIEMCSSRINEDTESLLSFDAEYLIFGHNKEYENLSDMVIAVLNVRERLNYEIYENSEEKRRIVKETALNIAEYINRKDQINEIESIIETAWIEYESIEEVREILSGGKNPYCKEEDDWKTGFDKDSLYVSNRKITEEGFDYNDYLRLQLIDKEERLVLKRFANILEINVRENTKENCFKIDEIFDAVTMTSYFESSDGKKYEVSRNKDITEF